MVAQEPAEAGQPAKPRESATSNSPANEARSTPPGANGQDPPVPSQLEEEGIYDLLPSQQVKAQQQHTAAGRTSAQLGRPKLGRVIHVNTARFLIAVCALATLMFVVFATFWTLWRGNVPIENLMRVLEVLFAPLIALVGVAVAFYYRGNPPLN
jgi:hypothetical protein